MPSFDMDYVKGKMGILKIIEMIFNLIVISCITVSKKGFEEAEDHEQHKIRYSVLGILHIIGVLLGFFVFLGFLIKLYEFLASRFVWNIVNLLFCVVMVIGCLICGIIMIVEAKHEHDSVLFKTHQGKWRWYTNNTIVAVTFNFLALFVFLIDGIIQICLSAMKGESEQEQHPRTLGEEIFKTFCKNQ